MDANRRVQKFLDAAAEHGWTAEHPTPEVASWLVYPHQTALEGFVVYGLPNDAAKVLRASDYKPVSQRDALREIEDHHHDEPSAAAMPAEPTLEEVIDSAIKLVQEARRATPGRNPLDQTGVEVRTLPGDDSQDIVVVSEFVVPDELDPQQKSEFCSGAMLAATTVSRLVDQSLDTAASLIPEEAMGGAFVTPPNAAHAYLHLANQVRDPKTLRIIFQDGETPPSEAAARGAQTVCKSLIGVWTAFADGLFALDPDQGAPLGEFMQSLHEHAEFIRASADETFGEFVTLSDADFESLLS